MVYNYTSALGDVIALRFDLGTSRILKTLTKVDPVSESTPADFEDQAADIFLAGYKRSFAVLKQPQPLADSEARDMFFELELTEAIKIVKMFTGSITVAPDPTLPVQEVAEEGDAPKKS